MAKFIYITDTHYGGSSVQFFEQPSYPDQLPELLSLLDARIRTDRDIQFVVHGGDMINECSEEIIRSLPEVFRLSVPVYLCLGNHDLTHLSAWERWRRAAPLFFPAGNPNFSFRLEQCFLHIVPNQWGDVPYYWKEEQDSRFLEVQLETVGRTIRKNPGCTHLVFTHSNVIGVLPEQTGLEKPYNSPKEPFRQQVRTFVDAHPQVRYIISGHTHVNTNVSINGVRYITASSFVETPFEYKIFKVDGKSVSMATECLARSIAFPAEYDSNREFVQGHRKDREFEDGSP